MGKKGFTLIELLAVIVILAIIAIIATPIVLNIIKDSKEQSKLRSLEMYVDGVNNAVAQYQLKTAKQPNNFEDIKEYIQMDNSNVSCDGGNFKNGQIPLQNCKVDNEIVIEDYIYGNVCVAVNENTATYRTDDTSKTVGYVASNVPSTAPLYNEKEPQYTPGVEYICEVKKGTYYRFYVLNTEGDNINLIMDSGISAEGKPVKKSGREHRGSTWNVDEEYGPVSIMEYLHKITKDWDNISNINIDYTDENGIYGGIKTTNNITSIIDVNGEVSASFTNLKARLPKKTELINTGCIEGEESCPLYLFNYLEQSSLFGGTDVSGFRSYFTLTSHPCGVYSMFYRGEVDWPHLDYPPYDCVLDVAQYEQAPRPVITLPKKLLSY